MSRSDFDLDIQVRELNEEGRFYSTDTITTAITCTCKTCTCPPTTTYPTCPPSPTTYATCG